MAEFYLKYNPYKIESTMKYNQKDIVSDSQLYAFKNEATNTSSSLTAVATYV